MNTRMGKMEKSRYTVVALTLTEGREGKLNFHTMAFDPDDALYQLTISPTMKMSSTKNIQIVKVKRVFKNERSNHE